MSDDPGDPLIGPTEQQLFEIEDTRERADRLRQLLTPKLRSLLDEACDYLRGAYGENCLSSLRRVATPANRKGAKKTRSYNEATAGLAVEGHHWYFQQQLGCNDTHIVTRLFGHRGHEANPLIEVLQSHPVESARLLDHWGFFLRAKQFSAEFYRRKYTISDAINELNPFPETDWKGGVYIEGPDYELPLVDVDSAWPVIYDFVALFPIFRAAADILLNQEDQFEIYVRQFWEWDSAGPKAAETEEGTSLAPPSGPPKDGGWEGDVQLALRRHRKREKILRNRKVQEALALGDGHLRCEVPGCGFDFLENYGDIGHAFAHVHHTNPLSGYAKSMRTQLSDLAIVCANCHAMIHRGNECRPLEGLIPRRP